MPAAIPSAEVERVAALRRYRVLDTAPESRFVDIARLAALVAESSMSIISFVDAEREWIKASVGVELDELSRDASLAAYVVLQDELLVIADARADPRLRDHPLVVGAPWVRSYVGAPIVTADGHRIGAVAALDCDARTIDPIRGEGLVLLARQVADHLEASTERRRLESRISELSIARKDTEDALFEFLQSCDDADETRRSFLARVTHELRTPLNGILGMADLLVAEAIEDGEEERRGDLELILEAGEYLMRIIDGILDIARIESGVGLEIARFELNELVGSLTPVIRPLAARNGNTLFTRLGAGLGAMISDETKVRQILFNLLGNACNYTQGGMIELGVERRAGEAGDEVCFTVRDTGFGMTPEQLARLYDEFTRFSTKAPQGAVKGTGLGMTVTRGLVDLLGGKIDVVSAPGVGTTFTVALPARHSKAPE
ncbi:MAG: GAF domain-containing sensor histidine kinase [Myxococcales bacterium]|nr:GAF domain-containing sensor histidine kinase [Myxococcales bacterium]